MDKDKYIKEQFKKDMYISEQAKDVLKNLKNLEVNMEEKNNKIIKINFKKYVAIAASLILIIFLGTSTYAHINGKETLISPLLRALGINSKYEESATKINKTQEDVGIKITMLDAGIDDGVLIVGYEVEMTGTEGYDWIDIDGTYKVNNIYVNVIQSHMDTIERGKYVFYDIFDISDINLGTEDYIKFSADIFGVNELYELHNLDSVEAVYGNRHTGNWNFEETLERKNVKEFKKLDINGQKIEIKKDLIIQATRLISSSFADILEIKTDKLNYKGDSFELFYKILDNKNNEIGYGMNERKFDYSIYTDRLLLKNVDKNSKITVEVYFKDIRRDTRFNKINTFEIDLSKAKETITVPDSYKDYTGQEFSFKYNGNWKIKTISSNDVGPNVDRRYIGALEISIPSGTSRSESRANIFVINKNYTEKQYIDRVKSELRVKWLGFGLTIDEMVDLLLGEKNKITKDGETYDKSYVESMPIHSINELEILSEGTFTFNSEKGYQITARDWGDDTWFINKTYFMISKGKIYRMDYFGSETDYNNTKADLDKLIETFIINVR